MPQSRSRLRCGWILRLLSCPRCTRCTNSHVRIWRPAVDEVAGGAFGCVDPAAERFCGSTSIERPHIPVRRVGLLYFTREDFMHRVGIVNVTSYMGAELVRLLAGHPGVTITCVTGRSA